MYLNNLTLKAVKNLESLYNVILVGRYFFSINGNSKVNVLSLKKVKSKYLVLI